MFIAKIDGDVDVKRCKFLEKSDLKNWNFTETYFVDNSGFGSDGESALTFRQFLKKVKKNRGYAIKEAGQFQIYINEYIKL